MFSECFAARREANNEHLFRLARRDSAKLRRSAARFGVTYWSGATAWRGAARSRNGRGAARRALVIHRSGVAWPGAARSIPEKGSISLYIAPGLYKDQKGLYEACLACEYTAVSIIESSYLPARPL